MNDLYDEAHRRGVPIMAVLQERAETDTVERFVALAKLYGISVGVAAIPNPPPFKEIAEAAEKLCHAASAAAMFAEES